MAGGACIEESERGSRPASLPSHTDAESALMRTRRPHGRAARRYLAASAFCALFAFVYAQFSHGVSSPFMTFLFVIPLLGGALPALIARIAGIRPAPLRARQAGALAIACLTLGSCLRGVFDIAGTSSALLWAYPAAAAAFAIAALIVLAKSQTQ